MWGYFHKSELSSSFCCIENCLDAGVIIFVILAAFQTFAIRFRFGYVKLFACHWTDEHTMRKWNERKSIVNFTWEWNSIGFCWLDREIGTDNQCSYGGRTDEWRAKMEAGGVQTRVFEVNIFSAYYCIYPSNKLYFRAIKRRKDIIQLALLCLHFKRRSFTQKCTHNWLRL